MDLSKWVRIFPHHKSGGLNDFPTFSAPSSPSIKSRLLICPKPVVWTTLRTCQRWSESRCFTFQLNVDNCTALPCLHEPANRFFPNFRCINGTFWGPVMKLFVCWTFFSGAQVTSVFVGKNVQFLFGVCHWCLKVRLVNSNSVALIRRCDMIHVCL